MASVAVRCPRCGSDEIIKRGKTDAGSQRYWCRNAACAQGSFLLEYRYQGSQPLVKRQIVDMALNGSGIRDTARVLGISKDTVLSSLKKSKPSWKRSIGRFSTGWRKWNGPSS